MLTPLQHDLLLIGVSALAGAVNSVAGGGTLLTFPALLAGGMVSTVANATNGLGLLAAQGSSLWGYRREVQQNVRAIWPLTVIGVSGGLMGAYLLVRTPVKVFDRLVPFLVLAATVLFIVQEPLARWQKGRGVRPPSGAGEAIPQTLRVTPAVALFLLGIAIYGGYFGAGIGILTLAALGLLGLTNIHQMNGIKAIFTLGINGVASVLLAVQGLVEWRAAALMALGSVFGGWAGAGIARRIGQKNVRRIVIGIGLSLSVSLLLRL